jgi:tRNA dimethylallyltransferase
MKNNNILNPIKIIAIVGPTASGKSDLAIRLAQKFNGEIISADSRQVYKGMDIGTGKISKKEQRLLPHHLIDIVSPKKIFTVAEFKKRGEKTIKDISNNNKIPIIVGGTGQYIDTLIYNLSLPQVTPNYKLRSKLEKQTVEQLFKQLKKLDPQRAKNIDAKNPRRLIRAIEIITATGQPIEPIKQESPYRVLWLGLKPKDLDKRISTRLLVRIKQGMISEVKKLHSQGISWQRLYDLGLEYRWVGQYLQNKITKDEMIFDLEQSIRQYSKRQMTWFKRNKNIHWIKSLEEAKKLTKAFV